MTELSAPHERSGESGPVFKKKERRILFSPRQNQKTPRAQACIQKLARRFGPAPTDVVRHEVDKVEVLCELRHVGEWRVAVGTDERGRRDGGRDELATSDAAAQDGEELEEVGRVGLADRVATDPLTRRVLPV